MSRVAPTGVRNDGCRDAQTYATDLFGIGHDVSGSTAIITRETRGCSSKFQQVPASLYREDARPDAGSWAKGREEFVGAKGRGAGGVARSSRGGVSRRYTTPSPNRGCRCCITTDLAHNIIPTFRGFQGTGVLRTSGVFNLSKFEKLRHGYREYFGTVSFGRAVETLAEYAWRDENRMGTLGTLNSTFASVSA